MKKSMLIRILLIIALFTIMLGCATTSGVKEAATGEAPAVITEVKIQDDRLDITSDKPFVYTLYSSDPYKILLDIPDMTAGSFGRKIVSEKEGFSEVTLQQTDGPRPSVKGEVLLQNPSSVIPVYKGNTLTLTIKHEEPVTSVEIKEDKKALEIPVAVNPEPGEQQSPPREEKAPALMPRATEISSVELKKSDDSVNVRITGNGTMMPNVFPLDEKIVVDIPGVTMHASIPSSVEAPLKGIRAGKYRDKVRLVLDLKEKTTFDVAAIENSIEISLKRRGAVKAQPPANDTIKETASQPAVVKGPVPGENAARQITMAPEPEASREGKYTGKKISLDFQDADIGPIFRLLADVNGYNLVLDQTIKGKVTIKLMNVPWDQALDIILNSMTPPLGHRIEGNIMWIAPLSKFESLVEEKRKSRETEEKAEELMQEIIRVNYATAADISAAVSSGKLLSARGSITIDSRMNTLIVKDTQKSIDQVKELMKIMDVAKPQVLIEAKLVTVSTNYNETLGIRWGGSFNVPSFPNTFNGDFSVNTPTVAAGPGATSPGGTLALNIGNASTVSVNLSLSALESIGKARTLSNPKILTMDNEAANIQQGTTFFIATVSQAGTQTQSIKATLSLSVTPKITPDGYVQLKVTASDDSLQPGTAGEDAVVNTKTLNTQALVKNGQTLVLGGIYTITETENFDQVPVLGRIPGFGWLFKTRNRIGPNVSELLIFITPTIVSQPL